jgi:hypothetical protein
MRRLLLMTVLLLMAGVAAAQEAQRTPPGGDMVGSDRSLQRGDIRTSPSPSPDQNQRMTNSAGATSGYEKVPAYSGASVDQSRQQTSNGRVGMQGQTAATAGRKRTRRQSAKAGKSAKRAAHHKKPGRRHSQRSKAPPR